MTRLSHHFQELMHLRIVLEQGSINRAAAQVGLTQPALTRSIGRLEASLGVQLLNRTARGVFPTAYGEAILSHIKLINSELERAGNELEIMKRGMGGQITCGGTIGAVNRLFGPTISQIKKRKPRLRVRVIESFPINLLSMLRTGDLDVVVCAKTNDLTEVDLTGELLGTDRVGLFVGRGNSLLKTPTTTLEEVSTVAHWILPNWSGAFYRLIQGEFQKRNLPVPTSAIETSSTTLLKSLLKTNDRAVAITTSNVIGADLTDGSIRELKGDWKLFASHTMIYLRADVAPSPPVQLFIQCIKSVAAHRGSARS